MAGVVGVCRSADLMELTYRQLEAMHQGRQRLVWLPAATVIAHLRSLWAQEKCSANDFLPAALKEAVARPMATKEDLERMEAAVMGSQRNAQR